MFFKDFSQAAVLFPDFLPHSHIIKLLKSNLKRLKRWILSLPLKTSTLSVVLRSSGKLFQQVRA